MFVDEDILNYYGSGREIGRLERGISRIEFTRTKELMARLLPPPPVVIYDVGGGPGAYSCHLATLGYEMHLLELSPTNVAYAQEASAKQPQCPITSIQIADGRALPKLDASADVVLLMGPLYHLPEREDRMLALSEAWRVLKPGGLLLAAALPRYGSTLWALATYGKENNLLAEAAFQEMSLREMGSGQHIRPECYQRGCFTRAYFHSPENLREEIIAANFADFTVYAVEGPAWLVPQFEALWDDETHRENILRVVRKMEQEPSLMSISPHLLARANKL